MDRTACAAFFCSTNQGAADRHGRDRSIQDVPARRAYARDRLNQARKFSNAKVAVFRVRCGE
jgi:hypothetical protein